MALERQLISLAQNGADGEVDGVSNGVETRPTSVDGDKTPRLPRWTRQEILVLIQGKRVAETRARRGRTAGLPFGSGQVEPKWASVSSYCKRHGVNRGPVQCRKRWSNLAGDYKKIKEWESQVKEETESFWVMRNDLRRERKLPGFFDKEVYDILDSGSGVVPENPGLALALAPAPAPAPAPGPTAEEVDEGGVLFDSRRSAVADEGLFSDFEHEEDSGQSPEKVKEVPVPGPMPISEKQYQPVLPGSQGQGTTTNEKQPASNPEIGSTSQEGRKRKRFATEEDEETISLHNQLVDILERNGKMLASQLEAQNANFQLDREQRKDDVNSLVGVLSKLADALARIADKL